jgi:glycosyltransferase involved in cell wall biosynthesis
MPRVSVIVNVHNGAATLHEAMQSVLRQTFCDWEMIVWDDCSTDSSAEIVATYADSRIRYFFTHEHTNLAHARYLAIQAAAGEWLAFLDQDDIWLPRKLEKQMALAMPGVAIVYGRTVMFFRHGAERDFDHLHEFEPLPEGDIFVRLFTESCFIAMSSVMLLRSAVVSLGAIPDVIQTSPDYYYFVALARDYEARAVQEVICRYRRHPGGMSASHAPHMQSEAIWVVDRWAACLDPLLAVRRRKIHYTVIAVHDMRNIRTMANGVRRLLAQGSVPFLLTKPFVLTWRAIRRRFGRPEWRKTSVSSQ